MDRDFNNAINTWACHAFNAYGNANLLDFVKQEFDFVIIDGCPIQDLSDSIILSKLVDATIMTVKMDKTLITDLINSLNRLENVHSNMLGIVVMNAVQKNSSYSQQLNKDVKRIA